MVFAWLFKLICCETTLKVCSIGMSLLMYWASTHFLYTSWQQVTHTDVRLILVEYVMLAWILILFRHVNYGRFSLVCFIALSWVLAYRIVRIAVDCYLIWHHWLPQSEYDEQRILVNYWPNEQDLWDVLTTILIATCVTLALTIILCFKRRHNFSSQSNHV
jgi:hypothetical protein